MSDKIKQTAVHLVGVVLQHGFRNLVVTRGDQINIGFEHCTSVKSLYSHIQMTLI